MHDTTRLTGWQSALQIADGLESGWMKAFQLGRGPPYVPMTRDESVPSVWMNPRRIDRKIRESDESEDTQVVLGKSERASYALGLLGVEDDLDRLQLKDDPWSKPEE